jgi:dihydrofolate reductase
LFFEISETFDSFKIKTKVLKVITLGRNTFGSLGQGLKFLKKKDFVM